MSGDRKINPSLIIKVVLIFLISSAVSVFLFAVGMYFLEGGYKYSPLFATVSVAVGCFVASFFMGAKIKEKGILIGLAIGLLSFGIITFAALLVNNGAVGMHILLRLCIMLLSALIGAILGVNNHSQPKYI